MATKSPERKPACGLCGRKTKLTKTECCDNWICDDMFEYDPFSYAQNSCHRNHDRYTLCAAHQRENHQGSWQDCKKCKVKFDIPHFVWYGTNKYNFEVLKNPDKITIWCANCGFAANTIDAFPLETSEGFYCAKDRCQKAGWFPIENYPSCGLCGNNMGKLKKTECCNNWICDDEDKYVMFSYARNSCSRNHFRLTLCANHYFSNHRGRWQNCKKCKDMFEAPYYVWSGTNKYNFEVLENPERVYISCKNCGYTANTIDAFPLTTSKGIGNGVSGYYCPKEKCQKAGMAS